MHMQKDSFVALCACIMAMMMIVPTGLFVMSSNDTPAPEIPAAVEVENHINTVIVQSDLENGKDTLLTDETGYIDGNYGSLSTLWVGNGSSEYRSLLEFEMPQSTGNLESATLSLYPSSVNGDVVNVSVYGASNSWSEGVGNSTTTPLYSAANWTYRTSDILFEDFEGTFPPSGWAKYQTGDAADPGWVQTTLRAYSGTNSAYHNDDNLATSATSWLVMPRIDARALDSLELSYWENQNWNTYYAYHGIWISTVSGDPTSGDFTEFLETGTGTEDAWDFVQHNLSAYIGSQIYIAFRYEGDWADEWYIDDVRIMGDTQQMWDSPGGDFYQTPSSYQDVPLADVWYSWDVTDIVNNWLNGTWENNGFLMASDNPNVGIYNYVTFMSSEDLTVPDLSPKLILTYSAEIDPPIPGQIFNEDDTSRTIGLAGRSNGSAIHISGADTLGNTLPFWGASADQMHAQYLYTPDQIGAEGVIRSIAFERTNYMDTGSFNSFTISLAHTNLTALTDTFANNFQGSLIEVLPTQTIYVNSSNLDPWVTFCLNGNFTYDSTYNLLVDITWNGDSGDSISMRGHNVAGRRLYNTAGAATGTVDTALIIMRFTTDIQKIGVIDNATGGNTAYPFRTIDGESRSQMLFHSSWINESGVIDVLRLMAIETAPDWAVVENVSIRMAHSTNNSLTVVFDNHNSDAWVEVLNVPSLNISHTGGMQWVGIDVNNVFNYNGVDNLLIDIRWSGGYSADGAINFRVLQPSSYDGFLVSTTFAATTGTLYTRHYNAQFIFQDSGSLTWSALTSNPEVFTASVTGNNLVITPVADAFGIGEVWLTLTNSEGGSVTQSIPVTVNPVNDDPVISNLTALNCIEDIAFVLNMTGYVSDIDSAVSGMTYSTTSSYASVNGSEITFLYPEGVFSENITITANDGDGGSASTDVDITVTPVNDPPVFTGFVDVFTCEATLAKTYTLHPEDEETITGQLDITTSSPYATVTGQSISFLYPKGVGTEVVNIHLLDGTIYGSRNNITYTLTVTINDHPSVVAHSPNGTAVPVTSPIVVTFDVVMNTTSAEEAFSFSRDSVELNGTFSWNANSTVMTFTPEDVMSNGVYDVRIAASASGYDGFTMFAPYAWNFTAALGDYDGDGDGMPDQYELDNGLDPLLDDAAADDDGDGMPNLYEYENDLNPQVDDADEDSDGDGVSNLDEYKAGTDPNDPEDKPSEFPMLILIFIIVIVVVIILMLLVMKGRKTPDEKASQNGVREWDEPEQPDESQGFEEPEGQDDFDTYEEPAADEPPAEPVQSEQTEQPPPPPPPQQGGEEIDPSQFITE